MDEAGPMPTLVEKLECERWMDLDLELVIATGEVGKLEETFGEKQYESEYGVYETIALGKVDWDRVLRDTNALFNAEMAAMKKSTKQEVVGALAEVRGKYGVDGRMPEDLGKRSGETREAYTERVERGILGTLVMDMTRERELEQQMRMQEEMAMAVAAAGIYRAEKGKWPGSLEEMVPGYLKDVPVDVYSKSGEESVRYVVGEKGVRVYSVGRNGVDDGGVAGGGGDDLVVGVVEGGDGP